MYKFEDYTLIVKETDKELYIEVPENRFIAFLKEIPASSLRDYGPTQEDAIKNLKKEFDVYSEELRDKSIALPAPETKVDYSGRILLRLPKWLHARIADLASDEEISINSYIVDRLINNSSVEGMFKTFCNLQQRLFEESPYRFNSPRIKDEKHMMHPLKLLSLKHYGSTAPKEDYGNVG